jgi:uncharacterized protein (DUF302 family)
MRRLETIVRERGLTLFAKIEFDADAKRIGLPLPFTQLLVFGNPAAGTPVIQNAAGVALDLPLKILVTEEANGEVWMACNTVGYLQHRHSIAPELVRNIAAAEVIMQIAAA